MSGVRGWRSGLASIRETSKTASLAGDGGGTVECPDLEPRAKTGKDRTIQGFNVRRWSDRGLNYWAVSDIGADELNEFGEKFEAAERANKEG